LDAFTALVVARGGSKSVPRKNLRPLGGKPLIAWTLEAARASRRLTRIVLSTDDPEIAAVGQQWGVETPFLRPAALAGDRSPVIDATLHAFNGWKKTRGHCPTFGLLLQPTSPFRRRRYMMRDSTL
jgi:CMP-N-acetylneuraminic acid synthetase